MNTLARHIEHLLLSNDCVIIPDFGGFVAHHACAVYDEQEQIFLPPYRTLGFNPLLTMNDSLLVQQYVQTEDVSYPEALKMIEDEVERIRLSLETIGQYHFEGIGNFTLNEEGKREFTPTASGIVSPKYFGMSFVEINDRKSKEDTVVDETHNDVEVNAETITIRKSTLQLLAAACVALVLFFTLPSDLGPLSSQTRQANLDSGKWLLKLIPTTEVQNPMAEVKKSLAQQESPVADIQPETTSVEPATPNAQSYFTLVLASQVSKKNAADFIDQLQKKGFPQASILEGKFRRVVYGVFSTQAEAYNKLQQLRSDSHFNEAWVLEVKE